MFSLSLSDKNVVFFTVSRNLTPTSPAVLTAFTFAGIAAARCARKARRRWGFKLRPLFRGGSSKLSDAKHPPARTQVSPICKATTTSSRVHISTNGLHISGDVKNPLASAAKPSAVVQWRESAGISRVGVRASGFFHLVILIKSQRAPWAGVSRRVACKNC